MTTQEIKDLISSRAGEHDKARVAAADELKAMKKEKTIESASKHMILKDKIMFHKACSMALKQVLEEIT